MIKSLTIDSGRTVFSTTETLKLQKISYLEGIGDIENMMLKIAEFKKQYILSDNEWLC